MQEKKNALKFLTKKTERERKEGKIYFKGEKMAVIYTSKKEVFN